MVKVVINKGFFYGAGTMFGWKGEHHIHGVGIAEKFFRENRNGTILVSVSGKEYLLNVEAALAFINKYKSIETRSGTRIGVVSRDLLMPVITESEEVVNKKLFS